MEIQNPQATFDLAGQNLKGQNVRFYQKRLEQIQSVYQDARGMQSSTLMYTVYSYEAGKANKKGDLYYGLTVMEPVTVNGECNMTRGHFHSDRTCAEFYFGFAGNGLLLLMDEDGHIWAERVFRGSLHHIDGSLAHRLVNTGDSQLCVGACWPTTAGHDYAAIEAREFPCRIFRRDGKVTVVEGG